MDNIKVIASIFIILTICLSINCENTTTLPSKPHVSPKPLTVAEIKQKNESKPKTPLVIASEGSGPIIDNDTIIHKVREHIANESSVNKTVSAKSLTVQNKTDQIIPVKEKVPDLDIVVPKKDDGKLSVPKKGVSFPDNLPGVSNTSTTLKPKKQTSKPIIPHKPEFTEAGETHNIDSKTKEIPTKYEQLSDDRKRNRSEYIIPIVAVILSVPLVAIVLSCLYKRGKYWWQHRNYRRMDFLIEGMYRGWTRDSSPEREDES